MAAPIGKGDWIECIRAAMPAGLPEVLTVGATYQVEDVRMGVERFRTGQIAPALLLYGVHFAPPGEGRACWDPLRFRPSKPPGAGLIESLKAPPQRASKTEDA